MRIRNEAKTPATKESSVENMDTVTSSDTEDSNLTEFPPS